MTKPAPYSRVKHKRVVPALPKQKLPEGLFLVHNLGRFSDEIRRRRLGDRGFRAWVQSGKKNPTLMKCDCKMGWIKNHDINEHYIPEGWAKIVRH
jgi:hypothetical protein